MVQNRLKTKQTTKCTIDTTETFEIITHMVYIAECQLCIYTDIKSEGITINAKAQNRVNVNLQVHCAK